MTQNNTRRKAEPVENMARPLTAKQRAFISWYISAEVNCNGTEAARRAGYRGNDNTLATVAFENLRKPAIRGEIDQRMAIALSGARTTVEKVLQDLETTRVKALADGQYGAATRCSELQGRYLKMFTDRIEHVETIDDVSTEELIGLLQEIVAAGNIDLGQIISGNGSSPA